MDDAAIIEQTVSNGSLVGAFTDLAGHSMVFASRADQPATVVHEILHVLFDQSGLDMRLGTDRVEDAIQSIDHGLLAVLRANPGLVSYLTADAER